MNSDVFYLLVASTDFDNWLETSGYAIPMHYQNEFLTNKCTLDERYDAIIRVSGARMLSLLHLVTMETALVMVTIALLRR